MDLFSLQQQEFRTRHIGPDEAQTRAMLQVIGHPDLDSVIDHTVPSAIRMKEELPVAEGISEAEYLKEIKEISLKNKVFRSYIGMGYYDTHTPSVILRNLFENPGWYTQYTPYQAEISQGRLESLLNFQTVVADLTGLPIANASLLDEASAAAEAMSLFFNLHNKSGGRLDRPVFFVDEHIFPQTLDVVMTRALPLGIEVRKGDFRKANLDETCFGALIQYPNDQGEVQDYRAFIQDMHDLGAHVAMATDLLALTLLTPPGELDADAALGSSQRFGVPMGFGGPHAGFFATKEEFKRQIPGRIIGVSVDAYGKRALRMALQTREQHIKRERATSNICTAQALLANMAAMYAVYHGPEGLKKIALRVATLTRALGRSLSQASQKLVAGQYFDTLVIQAEGQMEDIRRRAEEAQMNFRYFGDGRVGISLDETTTLSDLADIYSVISGSEQPAVFDLEEEEPLAHIPVSLRRQSEYLSHPVFHSYHSETRMMRYMKMLENRDLSLNTSMISLGSCTMKLNAATEMIPLSWSHWSRIHPFVPRNQCQGYEEMVSEISRYLCQITALDACSVQPNSGAQGELAGLLTIRRYHESRGEGHRHVMLIPISAHGTNPASAVMAGYKVVVVKALDNGYIDMDDLRKKASENADNLAGIMVTYPSTYGVYEETILDLVKIIHDMGGQVYMDGANMNAQVGLTAPGLVGADVCHLNLHKTFAIPHGGGGPGVGPICVREHLKPFLPGHVEWTGFQEAAGAVSAAPYGSASILLISYAYIRMLGRKGLKEATEKAILNANYMRARLAPAYPILYTGSGGTCAHEFIVDLRPFKNTANIEAEDVAKRLMDYGFHAPTMSFPVAGTIMIEPTESEDMSELDRFCEAMLQIREEIREIEVGKADPKNNLLKNAPHTQELVTSDTWDKPYGREMAAFPLPWIRENKFWPSVSRVNNAFGDRNLICTCEPVSSYMEENESA